MHRLLSILAILLLPTASLSQELPQTLHENFSGWTPSRHADSWTLDGGVLTLVNDTAQEGSTLWTDRAYADFVMELEFKLLDGTIDSGVFVRQENDQIQIGESGSLKRDMTGSPYINGKGYPVEAEGVAELLDLKGWNAMKIVAVGSHYDIWLNGAHVAHYTSDTAVESGPIGIQLHPGREMRMQYRNVRLAELQ